jgi:hypothetical protein
MAHNLHKLSDNNANPTGFSMVARSIFSVFCTVLLLAFPDSVIATVYEVGPGQPYLNIGDVPWEDLSAGDQVLIHWRRQPYNEKWVISVKGTEAQPFIVRGVPNAQGERPVIDGRDATTRSQLNFWNEDRGIIKIGGSNKPPDNTPTWIVVESLDIRSGRPPYRFSGSM